MVNKIRVHAKAQNRIALGMFHAYLELIPRQLWMS